MDNIPATKEAPRALRRLREAMDSGMAPALAIMLDEQLFGQVQRIAGIMAKAVGFVPKHCVGNTEVCFAIVTRSLVWGLDPFAVAQSTYQPVEGAKVSYEAKLVQAILEQSGRLSEQIHKEYRGDWSKVQGKFRLQTSEKSGKRYAVANWPDEAEIGLGITVSALVKGELEPRTAKLDLRQCHPRNSTLWATDPQTQIYYRAIRMLGNVAMPGVLMGVPFRGEEPDEDDEEVRSSRARNVTAAQERAAPPDDPGITLTDQHGEVFYLMPVEVEQRVHEWCVAATMEELWLLLEYNPDNETVAAEVNAELHKRRQPPPDPLELNGIGGAQSFLAALRSGLEAADAKMAWEWWNIYRERAERASRAVAGNEAEALAALVAAKIESGA